MPFCCGYVIMAIKLPGPTAKTIDLLNSASYNMLANSHITIVISTPTIPVTALVGTPVLAVSPFPAQVYIPEYTWYQPETIHQLDPIDFHQPWPSFHAHLGDPLAPHLAINAKLHSCPARSFICPLLSSMFFHIPSSSGDKIRSMITSPLQCQSFTRESGKH